MKQYCLRCNKSIDDTKADTYIQLDSYDYLNIFVYICKACEAQYSLEEIKEYAKKEWINIL